MLRNLFSGFAAALAVSVLLNSLANSLAHAAEKTATPSASAVQLSLQDQLNQRADFEVVEMPLKDVCLMLNRNFGIQILLQLKKLEEASVSADTPVTKSFKQVRLSTILDLLLKDLELTYVEKDGLLLITTPEDAESRMEIRVYDCRNLIAMTQPVGADKLVVPAAARGPDSKPNQSLDGTMGPKRGEGIRPISEHDLRAMRLMNLIETNVDVASWNVVGGPGEISEYNGLIVVTQTGQTQDKVERLLDMLRQAAGLDAAKSSRVVR
jgi:hypothetical protein